MSTLKSPPCDPGYLSRKLDFVELSYVSGKVEKDSAGKFLTLRISIPEAMLSNLLLSNTAVPHAIHPTHS